MDKRKHSSNMSNAPEHPRKHQKRNDKHHHHPNSPPSSFARKNVGESSKSLGASRGKSQKIANLIQALDDVLEEDSLDQVLQTIGEQNINKCIDLRESLKQHAPKSEAIKTSASSQPRDPTNLPKSVSTLALIRWESSAIPRNLPPLPAVLDPTLEVAAFTHVGCGTGRLGDLNYERLEWIGDAYIELTSTLLISQTFPSLLPGKCAHLRESIVKNVTLAGYARQYGFDKRALLPNQLELNGRRGNDLTKVFGDIFEAYVAAVILSDPENGIQRASEWLKQLWSMTLSKEILTEERSGLKIDNPLWRLRGQVKKVEIAADPSEPTEKNPKAELRAAIGSKGVSITYRDAAPEQKDKNTKLAIFTMGVYLDGWGEKDKQLGFGRAFGKKEAGEKAATMALKNKKLIRFYGEKKKVFDAQMQAEREALEKQEAGSTA